MLPRKRIIIHLHTMLLTGTCPYSLANPMEGNEQLQIHRATLVVVHAVVAHAFGLPLAIAMVANRATGINIRATKMPYPGACTHKVTHAVVVQEMP
jgi:hypothetical protein